MKENRQNVVFLKGDNIYLRPEELSDVPLLTRWINDREVTRFLTARFPINTLNEEEYVKNQGKDKDSLVLLIVLCKGDIPIGAIDLHKIDAVNRNAELGVMIGEKQYWGNGYGPEAIKLLLCHAFNSLNLHKISLCVYNPNKRAIKAYEKCGFTLDGTLPEEIFLDGEYHDAYVMSVLRKNHQ